MLSPSYNFESFLKAVDSADRMDIIFKAEREVTEAERHLIRNKVSAEKKNKCINYTKP